MGTIITRKRIKGAPSYMARVTIKRSGKIVHQEHKTFDRRAAAASWITRREAELAAPGALDRAKVSAEKVTLGDAIDKYTSTIQKKMGRTKTQVLRTLKTYEIAKKQCNQIGSQDLVDLAQALTETGIQPSTVGTYLTHLSPIFTLARPAWHYPLDARALEDAFVVCRNLGLTGKGKERDRRPTLKELDQIMTHFYQRSVRFYAASPMHKIIAFAIFSTRRQEEITRITWTDYQPEHARVLVRDMKDPRNKTGNNIWCDLPEPAMQIIEAMPRTSEQIFPYTETAISAAFTRVCKSLQIQDLHFHDLRHDGISRLFELGFTIPKAASVSGHRSWASLKRYTHIRQSGDKYENWKWMDIVTASSSA